MGIQVAIRVPDDSSGTGLRKVHGPQQPKGRGYSKYPYLAFPRADRPWEGTVTQGLAALARWLEDKPALRRRAQTIKVHAVRSPEEVRGAAAKRDAERFMEEGS